MMLEQNKFVSMGEMIGNIAHQWRQPLNAISYILGNLQLKYELKKLDEPYFNKKVGEAYAQLDYMSNTIEDFRNFFKVNKEEKQNILIKDICEETLYLTNSVINSNQIKIIKKYDNSLVFIKKAELIQVLMVLINNSKDAFNINKITYKEVSIVVKDYKIYFTDNAGGIPKNIQNKLFEAYFTTKAETSGTGLGLYMSKQIIEEHLNGSIKFISTDDKTTFEIDLSQNIKTLES